MVLDNSDTPSLSWFKFQFWAKDATMHTTNNDTGKLYMMQQRMLSKEHDDAHYCAAIFKYAPEFVLMNREHCTYLCTDDKHKISIGEPGVSLSALPRDKGILVGSNDYSLISITPTVVLVNELPEDIEGSWYRGHPHAGLKISTSCPSAALRNATEIAKMLINFYGGKENVPPVLMMYTDGGPGGQPFQALKLP